MEVLAVEVYGQYILVCKVCWVEVRPDEDGDMECPQCLEVNPKGMDEQVTLIPAHPWPHTFFKRKH